MFLNANGGKEQISIQNMVRQKDIPPPGWRAVITKLPIQSNGRLLVEAKDFHSEAYFEVFLGSEEMDIVPGDLVLANGTIGMVYETAPGKVWIQIHATSLARTQ